MNGEPGQGRMRDRDVINLPILALAYVGDAVYELYVREYLLRQGALKVEELHRKAVDFVSASGQANAVRMVETLLSEDEMSVLKRGRNAKATVPRRADMNQYRQSTGLEALVGYLYLTGRIGRLEELMGVVFSARE